jgi:hypothetical protein
VVAEHTPTPEEEAAWEAEDRRRAWAGALRRATHVTGPLTVDGTAIDAEIITHRRAFAAGFATPDGGYAQISGRGIALDAIGLSLTRGVAALGDLSPERWADA